MLDDIGHRLTWHAYRTLSDAPTVLAVPLREAPKGCKHAESYQLDRTKLIITDMVAEAIGGSGPIGAPPVAPILSPDTDRYDYG